MVQLSMQKIISQHYLGKVGEEITVCFEISEIPKLDVLHFIIATNTIKRKQL